MDEPSQPSGNGDFRMRAFDSLLRFGPSALILCLVLWFVGTTAVDIGEQLIVMQERQAAAIHAVAVSNDNRTAHEEKEHAERMISIKRLILASERSAELRNKETKLLIEILRQLQKAE